MNSNTDHIRSGENICLIALLTSCGFGVSPAQPATTLTIQAGHPGKPISPDLFGIFFEDLN